MFGYLAVFAVSTVLSVVLTWAARAAGRRLNILDEPDGARKLHTRPVARTGGPAVYLAAACGACAAILLARGTLQAVPLLLGAAVVMLIGLWDDTARVRPGLRLALVALAAVGVAATGQRPDTVSVPFGRSVSLGWWAWPVTVTWLVGSVSAMNFIDGLDGLAGGVAVIAGLAFCGVGLILGNTGSALLALAVAGAALGFLVFNRHPASIFLGDSGSYALGFLLGGIALRACNTADGLVLSVPVVVLALPGFDTALTVVRRWGHRRPLLSGSDRRHIHHRLADAGLRDRGAVGLLHAVCGVLAGCALVMAAVEPARPYVFVGVVLAGLAAVWVLARDDIRAALRRVSGRPKP